MATPARGRVELPTAMPDLAVLVVPLDFLDGSPGNAAHSHLPCRQGDTRATWDEDPTHPRLSRGSASADTRFDSSAGHWTTSLSLSPDRKRAGEQVAASARLKAHADNKADTKGWQREGEYFKHAPHRSARFNEKGRQR